MTYQDNPNPNLFERIRRWKSTLPWNNTRVPQKYIFPLFSICVAKVNGKWSFIWTIGREQTDSLFYNGAFYFRLMLPFFVGLHIRWAGKDTKKREFLQTYIGVKLNGDWALVPRFRIQSDESAARGTTGPNYGQAVGFEYGTK